MRLSWRVKDSFLTHSWCYKTDGILRTLGDRLDIFLLDDFGVLNVEVIAMAALFAQEEKMSTSYLIHLQI